MGASGKNPEFDPDPATVALLDLRRPLSKDPRKIYMRLYMRRKRAAKRAAKLKQAETREQPK